MGLTRLGNFIELVTRRNTNQIYGEADVCGVSNNKEIMPTKANNEGRVLDNFYVVSPDEFLYNSRTTRMGEKIGLGYNDTGKSFITSWNNTAFRMKDDARFSISPAYLFIYFNRPEFDRYSRFNSWGSSTEIFSWDDMCDIDIDLPPLPIQQKYVDVYNAILANQRAYERGLDDLNTVIDVNLEKFKHTAPRMQVGKLLEEIDVRNRDGSISNVQGINIKKEFMPSVANLTEVNLSKYKVVKKNQFAYSAMQTGRDECIRIALFHENEPVIISSAYSVLRIMNESALSEYVMLWFSRRESDRYGWFISDSSIRASLELQSFCEIEIPLPSPPQQQAVVNLYNSRYLIKQNITKLRNLLKGICPILIKGSLEEAKR
jgi:type I restriction enzyme, S subunit